MGSYETNITVTRVHSILSTVLPLLPCRSQRWTQRDLWYIWPLRLEREQRNPWCAELVSGWQWTQRIPSQCPGNGPSRIAPSDLWPSWRSQAWWGDRPKRVHQICWGGCRLMNFYDLKYITLRGRVELRDKVSKSVLDTSEINDVYITTAATGTSLQM